MGKFACETDMWRVQGQPCPSRADGSRETMRIRNGDAWLEDACGGHRHGLMNVRDDDESLGMFRYATRHAQLIKWLCHLVQSSVFCASTDARRSLLRSRFRYDETTFLSRSPRKAGQLVSRFLALRHSQRNRDLDTHPHALSDNTMLPLFASRQPAFSCRYNKHSMVDKWVCSRRRTNRMNHSLTACP